MWLLALIFASFSYAAASGAGVCEDRFLQLLQTPAQTSTTAPKRITMPLTTGEVQNSFDLALNAWHHQVDMKRLRRLLDRIKEDPDSAEDLFSALKQARKFASILRSNYLLLSASHEPPKAFEDFTKELGDLNDAIANRAGRSELKELAKKVDVAAGKVSESIDDNGFVPASLTSLRGRLDEIRNSIAEVTGDKLPTPHTFHVARKAAKELLAFYQTREALNPSDENRAAYNFLFQLNEDMGKVHDDFVSQARRGEIDYEHQKFFMYPPIKAKLQQLEAALASD